jgi:uncharacterized membrane protein YeaQ/YmgE (transglycosylase-associated protein family)
MNIVPLIIQLVSGAVGGNIVGWLVKKLNLGWLGNSLSGIVGGGLVGQLLPMLGVGTAGSLDLTSVLSGVLGGGVGGGAVMAIVGLIKNALSKKK